MIFVRHICLFRNEERTSAAEKFSVDSKDDPSLLLIGAGMAPLKPYFTGKVEPPCHRVTTSQKCIRTGDIENVGRTARHHTFLKCLGISLLVITLRRKPLPGHGNF